MSSSQNKEFLTLYKNSFKILEDDLSRYTFFRKTEDQKHYISLLPYFLLNTIVFLSASNLGLDFLPSLLEIPSHLLLGDLDFNYPEGTIERLFYEFKSLDVKNSEPDLFAKVIESGFSKKYRKEFGQFYTPQEIVNYIVDNISIKHGMKIMDPSCGTGCFLTGVTKKLLEGETKDRIKTAEMILRENIYGYDINPIAVHCAILNLLYCTGSDPFRLNLFCRDALAENSEEGKYDIVLGNPPYVSFGLRGTDKIGREKYCFYKKQFRKSAQYKISLYALFIEQGLRLLKDGGYLGYIIPDSFMNGRYFSKIREHIIDSAQIMEIALLEENVWKGRAIGKSVILILKKQKKINIRKKNSLKSVLIADIRGKQSVSYRYSQEYFKTLPHLRFRLFFNGESKEFIERVEKFSCRLGEIVNISSGLIGKEGKNSIISPEPKGDDWFPGLISSRQVTFYSVDYEGDYINFNRQNLKSGFLKALYFVPKLFIRQTAERIIAAYDDKGLLCLNNLHVLNVIDKRFTIFFLLGLLNSSVIDDYYRIVSLESHRVMPQTDIEMLEEIPVPYANTLDQEEIETYVKRIMNSGKGCNEELEKKLQNRIDVKINELFGIKKIGRPQ